MAKPTAVEEPTIEIHAYKPAEKALPYSAHIDALITAQENFPEGEYPATTVRVPNGEKNKKDEYMERAKHKRYIQDAAKARGYSAKFLSEEDFGDGTSTLEFGLRDAIKRARKPKGEDAADETPEQAAEAA